MLIILIAIVILAPKLPHGLPEDVSRDGHVDLQDAILLIKNFQDAAANPDQFKQKDQNLVSAFQIASKLKTIIKNDEPARTAFGSVLVDSVYIPSYCNYSISAKEFESIDNSKFYYKSTFLTLDTPPPRRLV